MASGCALIFDEEMTRYKLLWTQPACEVEVPERLTVCHDALTAHGLTKRCRRVPVRQATEQEILLVHSEEYLEAVKQTPKMTLEELMTFTKNYNDVYFHPNIYHCAKLAAGAALQLVDGVMKKEVRNGMALVRPPGHHSQRSAANGFCVFNNVAIAALYARKNYNLNRILIVDWDIHHGQGVQYCFEEDPSVLYFSWHRYEHQAFWPNLPESDYTSVGKGKGSGFNVNLPWNKVGMTNSDYLAAFFHVLLPIAYEFDPELVLVSAGFDSAIGDPEGRMVATPEIFAHLTQLLMPLAAGRMCAVLEGGYNLTSLPQSVCQTVQTLLGDPAPELSGLSDACESALESIQNVRRAHSSYWSCFKHADTTEANSKQLKLEENNSKLTEEEKPSAETESMKTPEDIVWPKPVPRPSPAVCTVVALPSGAEVSLPDGCLLLGEISQTVIEEAQKIWDKHFQDVKDQTNLKHVGNIISVLDQIKNKEVRNGCVVVSDLSVSVLCALQHTLTHLTERVLVVFIGDGKLPVDTSDGKILLVQICGEESEEEKCVNRMSLRLKEGEGFKAGFIHSVLGLLLPLAYEFNPGLVLGVVGAGNGKSHLPPVWGHLTSLLQGLAQGRTLALQQGYDKDLMEVTVTALSGGPVSPLGAQEALRPEDVEMMEKQRCRMQKRWGLLRCTVSES